ncbi:MAG TPA: DNA translocase FtsK [Clostridiaceae bacterium]|nr:DNA translocase FtsK [Clostridiaceae bacterium]
MKVRKIQKKSNYKKKVKEAPRKKYNQEITGILFLALGILTLLSLYFENSIGLFGKFVRNLFTGMMGVPSYVLPPVIIIYSILSIFKKEMKTVNLRMLYSIVLMLIASAIIQTGVYNQEDYINISPLACIAKFFNDGRSLNGGGVLGGIISIPFLFIFQTLGTIIILTTFAIIDIILLTNVSIANFGRNIKALVTNRRNSLVNKQGIRGVVRLNNEAAKEHYTLSSEEDTSLELMRRPKVIDFRIEKESRELNKKTKETKAAVESAVSEAKEHIGFIVEDLNKSSEQFKKDISSDKDNGEAAGGECEQTPNCERYNREYIYPPLDLLEEAADARKSSKLLKSRALEGAKKLEETLKSFGVEAKVINVIRGPAVTRYELQPSVGVKVSKIVNLADDISLNLASPGVRIEAPIPGKAAVGIEVANNEITPVSLKEVIDSPNFKQHPSKIAFAIGKDVSGECVVADIAKMPHLLIAGATGSGKSVCINSLIVSILYKASPDEVKLLMIDPKVVELNVYNGIPHLLIPVVTDPRKAAGALNWAVQEMVNRYKLFADRTVRDLKGYNELLRENGEEGILPEIVIIIDELADLMMVAPNDVEDAICRLAQMARAAGMHLVIATQRPSVDVITGVIKANIPSRISFAVSSQIDSRTILDMAGAEKLLGKGDMLFYPVGKPKPIRVQGAFVSEKEVERVVEYIKSQGKAEYDDNIIEEINNKNEHTENTDSDVDELLPQAIEMVVEAGQASVSLIQRKFKVGYARAARIIDQMEERGIIGGFEGSKPRQVLITKQQWQEMQLKEDN